MAWFCVLSNVICNIESDSLKRMPWLWRVTPGHYKALEETTELFILSRSILKCYGRSAQVFQNRQGKLLWEAVIFDYLTQLFWHFRSILFTEFPYNLLSRTKACLLCSITNIFTPLHTSASSLNTGCCPSFLWKSLSYWDCTKGLALSKDFPNSEPTLSHLHLGLYTQLSY